MTQEEKDLLLKDICERLFYGVKLQQVGNPDTAFELYSIDKYSLNIMFWKYRGKSLEIADCGKLIRRDKLIYKLYLRPMSSMTEEELKDLLAYSGLMEHEVEICKYNGGAELEFWLSEVPCKCISKVIDWLNKKMFDYRGLIPMNLALPAKEGMYNF